MVADPAGQWKVVQTLAACQSKAALMLVLAQKLVQRWNLQMSGQAWELFPLAPEDRVMKMAVTHLLHQSADLGVRWSRLFVVGTHAWVSSHLPALPEEDGLDQPSPWDLQKLRERLQHCCCDGASCNPGSPRHQPVRD